MAPSPESYWTPKREKLLKKLLQEGMSFGEASKELDGSTYDSVRKKAIRLGLYTPDNSPEARKAHASKAGKASHENDSQRQRVPPGGQNPVIKPLYPEELDIDDCLVACDFHVPGENTEWVERLINYATKNGVKHLIVAGDFWNHDAISRYQFKDPQMNFKAELKAGIALVKKLSKVLKIHFVCGNHDARMPKALDYSLDFIDWMDALFGDEVSCTNFDYLILSSGNRKFRVCHPDAYSVVKGAQVSSISHDLQENVIMGHQHYLSMGTNKTGKYVCIDAGCMCDQDKFYYKKSATTRNPHWENGFVHIKDGKVRIICDYTF